MAELLATLAQFKTYKSIPTANTKEDDSITQMLYASSEFVSQYCQRTFINFDEELIEYHDGSDRDKVHLNEFPIVDLLFEYSSDGGKTYTEATEFTEYFVGEDYITSGKLGLPLYNPTISHNAIKLTYTAGYEDLPLDLVQAVMDITEYFRTTQYNPKSSHAADMVERGNSDYNSTKLPSHILRVLSNYRRIV